MTNVNESSEPAPYAVWRTLVESDLGGKSFERRFVKQVAGVDVQPLYTAQQHAADDTGVPGVAPYRRGARLLGNVSGGWGIAQEIDQTESGRARQAAADAVRGGANWLVLRLDQPQEVLGAIPLHEVGVVLSAGFRALPAAEALLARVQSAGALASCTGCLGLDPLGVWAAYGSLPAPLSVWLAECSAMAREVQPAAPGLRTFLVNGSIYHEAGADAGLELGVMLATGVAYLRALTERGLSLVEAAAQLAFEFSVGTDVFLEIAKLRAARVAWSKVLCALGVGGSVPAMFSLGRGSRRALTRIDAWTNLLRGTTESFAAVVGGCDVVITPAVAEALGESDALGLRLARNTQHVLAREAQLGRVIDPAGGSFYVESLTDELARRAWSELRRIEAAGGIQRSLASGELQRELGDALESERRAVETRRRAITGVTEFVAVDAAHAPAHHARRAAPHSERDRYEPCPALVRERLAEPFERLRARADELLAARGRRPLAYLANLGAVRDYEARATFSRGYFEAGGFAIQSDGGFQTPEAAAAAYERSGADLCVLCSSDAVYAALGAAMARGIAACGPRALLLAGDPGAAEAEYRAAGITDFIFLGQNAVHTLAGLIERIARPA